MAFISFKWAFIILFFHKCTGLYEDQIGKFEWRQQYIGKLKYADLEVSSSVKKVVIATEQNILAVLSFKSGDILWRQILESDRNGTIKFLSVDEEIITISGEVTPLVRGWELEHGFLLWEWGTVSFSEHTKWITLGRKLIQIDFYPFSYILTTLYHISTGQKLKTKQIPATWLIPENCVTQNNVIACVNSDKILYSIKIIEGNDDINVSIHHRSLLDLYQGTITGNLEVVPGKLPIAYINVAKNKEAILLQPEIQAIKGGPEESDLFTSSIVAQQKLVFFLSLKNEVLHLEAKSLEGKFLPEFKNKIEYPEELGKPEFALMLCQPKKEKEVVCRVLISTSHEVILLFHHTGKILWSREESLASILSVEMVNLPVSDTDAAIEKEFDNKNASSDFGISCGFIGMFFRRILSQTLQLQSLILTVLGLKRASVLNDNEAMIQDEFGLHKLIVVATKTGKIFGIDNLTGKIVWQIKLDNVAPFSTGMSTPILPLYLLRNARHHPLPPECALLAQYLPTSQTAVVRFNPITGITVGPEKIIVLDFKLKQSVLLHLLDENFSKGIALLDEKDNVYVYPENSLSVALKNPTAIHIYTANASSGILEGFTLSFNTKEQLICSKTWKISLGSNIISLIAKNNNERVHSQGRVLGDRSVLYKYVNPNLIAVVTKAYHPSHKTIINLYLIDVVTGNIIYSSSHRRAKEPFHVVHSENWVIYTYFNDKYRRTELGALEMYEGKTQSNATAFSSVDSAILLPIVERQAYVLPANVLCLKETITEKGITSKHILVALSTGGILELPWSYADPRRPLTVTQDMREEGIIPYMPELPTPLEAIINHNQTVNNIRSIYTSSSGLESTCLVFAFGLDIFYTRVAPSKTFDLLKDDFDYYLIMLVLVALTLISYITKKLSSRKALKQAWK